jgi:hypothetical protein
MVVATPAIRESIAKPNIALFCDSKAKRYIPKTTRHKPTKADTFGYEVISPDDRTLFTALDLEWAEAFRLCLFDGIINSSGLRTY